MYNFIRPETFVIQVGKIDRSTRWSVCRRLQELEIPCWCPEDGTLLVEIHDCIAAVLLRSTIQQFTSTRVELADWLDRCWSSQVLTKCDN